MIIISEIEDYLCFICCIILFPLSPIFYLIDYIFNTEIMHTGKSSSKLCNEIDDLKDEMRNNKMDNITLKEYKRIMHEYDELINLILTRTKEMSNILHDRDPIGTCCDTDFDINADGSLLVQFEDDYDCDSYNLPSEFIFSEDYRKNYKVMIEKEKYDKELKEIEDEKIKYQNMLIRKEEHDKSEYERLKIKYGD